MDSTVYYTVKSGDNLSNIATKFWTTYQAIADLNNIEEKYIIYPGEN